MRKVSLRNLSAHKLRMALTIIAVVLGTAFISGAFMFTNALSSTFTSAVATAYEGVDVSVSPDQEAGTTGISQEIRDAVAANDGVAQINFSGSTTVVLADAEGNAIQTAGMPAGISIWYDPADAVAQSGEIVEGAAPEGAAQVMINDSAAEKFDITVGEKLLVVDPQQRTEVTVSGIYEPAVDAGPAISVSMAEDGYLERYTDGVNLPSLAVAAAEGVDPTQLVDELRTELEGVSVETGETLAAEASEAMELALSFVNYFLLAFGLVALLVGTFLIANTFSMIVAQRTKEFALLRALGASQKQITRSVVFEALIVGIVGSAIGVVVGLGLVQGIKALLAAFDLALPESGLGLTPASVIVPIVLGALVTVVSAWMPARRAGAVKPVEAMRTTESAAGSSLKGRTIIGALLITIGVLAALAGAFLEDASTGNRASLVGVGALGVIIGFFLAGPAFSLPVVPGVGRVIGAPFGAVGKLAATNSKRNPRRTATTAFALTLGVALVTAIGMLGDTMKSSISDMIENDYHADYILSGPTNGSFPVPFEATEAVRETAGVGEVVTLGMAPIYVDDLATYGPGGYGSTNIVGGDAAEMIKLEVTAGTSDLSGTEGVAVDSTVAAEKGWAVGDTVQVSSPLSLEPVESELVGIFEPNFTLGRLIVSQELADAMLPPQAQMLLNIGVMGDGSVDLDQLRSNLETSVKDFIVVQVMTGEEIAGQATQAIDMMMNILYALLALAVIIAILGIVNTLTLNVIERRQEIGMLRAVGGQRTQVRTMITLEAVQIAVFGAIMGMLIGLFLGWSFIKVLAGEGLDSLSIPWDNLGWTFLGSIAVGVLAAIWPAQRAAKTPALDAIAQE
ncbi:ABC transporter permease [Corynebacterium sp. A21]|uniref:ABC transporter permease n=1 Tax=Corynebacterium sp. A21 TaxID=3457318 RepID=UPI003FCF237A